MALERIGLKPVGAIFSQPRRLKDLNGFIPPYKFLGKLDLELMQARFQSLDNKSKNPFNVRLRRGRK